MASEDQSKDLLELMTSDGPFSFVIIGTENKNDDPLQIYEMVKETLGLRPFIFIGSSESLEACITDDILKHPSTNFVLKTPLEADDFIKAINSSLEWVKNEEFEESVLEFNQSDLLKLRLRNFYLFDQLPYDVYLELTPSKFSKIITKNKVYSHQLIQNYSRKNVKYFHLKKDDHLVFLHNSIQSLIKVYEAKATERKNHSALHLKTIFFIQQFIKSLSVTEDVIKLTHLLIDSAKETVKSEENLSELLDEITKNPNLTFAEQSLATAYVCESIIFYMGWSADMSRNKLLLASILQDITLQNEELIKIRSLNDPNFQFFTKEEQLDFINHPQNAAQLATLFNSFSDVDFILKEQHLQPNGGGFPKVLNLTTLTTISCIFILASDFVSRVASARGTSFSYREIIKNMKKAYRLGNFKDSMEALDKSFKK